MTAFLILFTVAAMWVASLLVHPFGKCWLCRGKGNLRRKGKPPRAEVPAVQGPEAAAAARLAHRPPDPPPGGRPLARPAMNRPDSTHHHGPLAGLGAGAAARARRHRPDPDRGPAPARRGRHRGRVVADGRGGRGGDRRGGVRVPVAAAPAPLPGDPGRAAGDPGRGPRARRSARRPSSPRLRSQPRSSRPARFTSTSTPPIRPKRPRLSVRRSPDRPGKPSPRGNHDHAHHRRCCRILAARRCPPSPEALPSAWRPPEPVLHLRAGLVRQHQAPWWLQDRPPLVGGQLAARNAMPRQVPARRGIGAPGRTWQSPARQGLRSRRFSREIRHRLVTAWRQVRTFRAPRAPLRRHLIGGRGGTAALGGTDRE